MPTMRYTTFYIKTSKMLRQVNIKQSCVFSTACREKSPSPLPHACHSVLRQTPSPQKCSVLLNLKRHRAFKHEALKSLTEYKVFCSMLPYKTSPEMKKPALPPPAHPVIHHRGSVHALKRREDVMNEM